MFFKDWRLCDISSVDLGLDKNYIYWLHARAWAMKGYLGGTHSWMVVWSNKLNKWLVIENTDAETVDIQNGNILHSNVQGWLEKGPFVTDRNPTQKWFGGEPFIIGKQLNPGIDIDEVIDACVKYPITEFKLLTQNCNTFCSYLILAFNLDFKRPLRSVGFRNHEWWKSTHGLEI